MSGWEWEMGRLAAEIAGLAVGMNVFLILMGLVFILLAYCVQGYAIMCIGRKAGRADDFIPFVPVARQIYLMRIVGCPIWYIFFFSTTTITVVCPALIIFALFLLTKSAVIAAILLVAYLLANAVITFLYCRELYGMFGFNPNAAWLSILPSFLLVQTVFQFLIAFSNSIQCGDAAKEDSAPSGFVNGGGINRGTITGIAGMYRDASFDLADGAEIAFGRSPQDSNVVFDQTATDISRKHCVIRFDGRANQYVITDYSSTGTFLENGTRLETGQPRYLAKGTVIYLGGSKKNGFRLN